MEKRGGTGLKPITPLGNISSIVDDPDYEVGKVHLLPPKGQTVLRSKIGVAPKPLQNTKISDGEARNLADVFSSIGTYWQEMNEELKDKAYISDQDVERAHNTVADKIGLTSKGDREKMILALIKRNELKRMKKVLAMRNQLVISRIECDKFQLTFEFNELSLDVNKMKQGTMVMDLTKVERLQNVLDSICKCDKELMRIATIQGIKRGNNKKAK